MKHLQPNTTLQGGKYRIERVLGQGGFGNTYMAINTVFNERVAIKEFFMQGISDRDESTGSVTISIERNKQEFEEQREKFKKEALRIRKLDNPHIVKVHDLFEENCTAYYVMDYIDGENLAMRMKRTGKPLTEQEVLKFLPQILDALKTVHNAGIWHLDLKPANIMVDKSNNVRLIDFGASKQLNTQKGGATTSTAISYTNGYAPREQMEQNYDKFGPWTDIYALGATLYNLLTNKRPPLPTDIDDDNSNDKHIALPMPSGILNSSLHKLIIWMMSANRNNRPQSVDEIKNKLSEQDRIKAPSDLRKDIVADIDEYDEMTVYTKEGKEIKTITLLRPKKKKGFQTRCEGSKIVTKDVIDKKQTYETMLIIGLVLIGVIIAVFFFNYFVSTGASDVNRVLNTDSIWTVDEIPMPHLEDGARYVSNPDELLSEETETAVNNVLRAIDDTFGIESAFVIVNHVENADPKAFAFQLGNKYGIGRDNRGVVFVLAYRDKRYFMAKGKALENELTDSICSIILDPMIPILKEDNIDDSVLKMTSGLYYKLYDIFDN